LRARRQSTPSRNLLTVEFRRANVEARDLIALALLSAFAPVFARVTVHALELRDVAEVTFDGTGPLSGTLYLHARVISRCFDQSGATTNGVSWFNITTSNSNCSMRVNFIHDGRQYALVMSPLYANTGRSVVTCTQASGNACLAWTILPNLTLSTVNPNPGVANLYSVDPKNGKATLAGTYNLTSYRVDVKYP